MTNAQFRSNDLSCISCSSSTTYISTQAECDKCGYRHWTQDPNGTTDSDGTASWAYCYPPATTDIASFGFNMFKKEFCDNYPNHIYYSGKCIKTKNCTNGTFSGRISTSSIMSCIECSAMSSAETTKEQCDLCPEREYNESTGVCYLKTCPQGTYQTSSSGCQACPESSAANANTSYCYGTEFCESCPNLFLPKGSTCCKLCGSPSDIKATPEQCAKCANLRYMDGEYCKLKT